MSCRKESYRLRLHRCTMRAYLCWLDAQNRLEAHRLGLCWLPLGEFLHLRQRAVHFRQKYRRCLATSVRSPACRG
jgi:hypothetical protein